MELMESKNETVQDFDEKQKESSNEEHGDSGSAGGSGEEPRSESPELSFEQTMMRNRERHMKRWEEALATDPELQKAWAYFQSYPAAKNTNSPVSVVPKRKMRRTFQHTGSFIEGGYDHSHSSSDDDDPSYCESRPRVRRSVNRRSERPPIIPVEEVTEEVLANISRDGKKVYDTVNGTSCHQCRQKTIDQKTCCRNPNCTGISGQLCGPCIRNRYGEDPEVALLDPNWTCFVCRGICNCSFCMAKQGKRATGILKYIVDKGNYKSAHEYLSSESGSLYIYDVDDVVYSERMTLRGRKRKFEEICEEEDSCKEERENDEVDEILNKSLKVKFSFNKAKKRKKTKQTEQTVSDDYDEDTLGFDEFKKPVLRMVPKYSKNSVRNGIIDDSYKRNQVKGALKTENSVGNEMINDTSKANQLEGTVTLKSENVIGNIINDSSKANGLAEIDLKITENSIGNEVNDDTSKTNQLEGTVTLKSENAVGNIIDDSSKANGLAEIGLKITENSVGNDINDAPSKAGQSAGIVTLTTESSIGNRKIDDSSRANKLADISLKITETLMNVNVSLDKTNRDLNEIFKKEDNYIYSGDDLLGFDDFGEPVSRMSIVLKQYNK